MREAKVCVLEIKGSETSFMLILSVKIDSLQKHYTSVPLMTRKCFYLSGKLGKHIKFEAFFVYMNDGISAIFPNFKPNTRPKLTYAYYSFSL